VGEVKGWPMYQDIQQLKELGLNKSQVERQLNINWKTVNRYWDVTPEEFAELQRKAKNRHKKLEPYREQILNWLNKHPDISSAQIHDWLKEYYPDSYQGRERSLRRYISELRKEYQLPKALIYRQYQAVEELPPGQQAQVDLGFKEVEAINGKRIKLFVFGLVLSHSRYKYVEWLDRPFTAIAFTFALYKAFEFIGGVPKEIVFDQDRVLVVSENYGDIIHTEEFERFRRNMKFTVYLCRGNDPETKGKIEAVVKYTKQNYAAHRVFDSLELWNEGCIEWLNRTGNASIHATTKKVPAEVFKAEREYLQPIPTIINKPENSLTRNVRKDNTVLYDSNRYRVPKGTYYPGREVELNIKDGFLDILDIETKELIVKRKISFAKGVIVPNRAERDYSYKISELWEQVLNLIGKDDQTTYFLERIKHDKPRYIRDQLQLIIKEAGKYPEKIIAQAINYCIEKQLWSAVEFRNAADYINQLAQKIDKAAVINTSAIPSQYKIQTEVRDLKVYTDLYNNR
jgi:transposase